jgi:hypothetical protein
LKISRRDGGFYGSHTEYPPCLADTRARSNHPIQWIMASSRAGDWSTLPEVIHCHGYQVIPRVFTNSLPDPFIPFLTGPLILLNSCDKLYRDLVIYCIWSLCFVEEYRCYFSMASMSAPPLSLAQEARVIFVMRDPQRANDSRDKGLQNIWTQLTISQHRISSTNPQQAHYPSLL